MKRLLGKIVLVAMVGFSLPAAPCHAADQAIGVLLSREIAPYVEMVEGLEDALGSFDVHRYFLGQQGQPFNLSGYGSLNPSRYRALVAVGPEALDYLLSRADAVPLVYGMVLNPEDVAAGIGRKACGVTLNIPIHEQFAAILRHLPDLERLGVLFDPANNQDWFDRAAPLAAELGLELVPLRASKGDVRLELEADFSRADAILFIPDKSIISKAVIQYVIRQALSQGLPVIGYNQFFYQSGAALSLVVDYRAVGQQTAAAVLEILQGDECRGQRAPHLSLLVNREIWQLLDLPEPAPPETAELTGIHE